MSLLDLLNTEGITLLINLVIFCDLGFLGITVGMDTATDKFLGFSMAVVLGFCDGIGCALAIVVMETNRKDSMVKKNGLLLDKSKLFPFFL